MVIPPSLGPEVIVGAALFEKIQPVLLKPSSTLPLVVKEYQVAPPVAVESPMSKLATELTPVVSEIVQAPELPKIAILLAVSLPLTLKLETVVVTPDGKVILWPTVPSSLMSLNVLAPVMT